MVQLKDYNSKEKTATNNISIPYGSIKRDKTDAPYQSKNRFQFLMVQLKECSTGQDII